MKNKRFSDQTSASHSVQMQGLERLVNMPASVAKPFLTQTEMMVGWQRNWRNGSVRGLGWMLLALPTEGGTLRPEGGLVPR